MKRTPALAALVASVALAVAGLGAAPGAAGTPGADSHRPAPLAKGSPGKWTEVSKGSVGTGYRPSLVRTSDGVLHLLYPKDVGGGTTLAHTAIHTDGSIAKQNNVLASGWSTMDVSPIVVSEGGSGIRALFAGQLDLGTGFWSQNRMYTATSGNGGSTWNLPAEALGSDNDLSGLYGMGATTLSDGTPVAASPLNGTLRWHVGTGNDADQSYTAISGDLYDVTLVRSGSTVWASWFQSGGNADNHGTFVMPIYPTVGFPDQAPGSSSQGQSISTGRTALVARTGGGVYLAYCVGFPNCTAINVWKVGTSKVATVPHTKFAQSLAMSAGPSGRLWITWADNGPQVFAVRTDKSGLVMGAVQKAGIPKGGAAFALAIDGSRGRGDIVLNDGNGLWHTQVLAGLTLHASPSRWQHGSRQKVEFDVTDAHAAVKGAKVKVGSDSCHTDGQGTCTITFPASYGKGKHSASASKKGYTKATTGLKVK